MPSRSPTASRAVARSAKVCSPGQVRHGLEVLPHVSTDALDAEEVPGTRKIRAIDEQDMRVVKIEAGPEIAPAPSLVHHSQRFDILPRHQLLRRFPGDTGRAHDVHATGSRQRPRARSGS
jgi:hypothetical protein